jgi:Outer membrane cobalamin receptor protein
MDTDTDIDRKNFLLSHSAISKKEWNFNQTIIFNSYSRNYLQKRPWGKLEKDDFTSEKYVEYEILLNKKINSNELNTGFEIYRATYSSDRIKSNQQRIDNQSLFGQYDMNFSNQLTMIYGLRLDNYSEYDRVVSPRLGFMYKFQNNWKLRTSWGQGFRAPSFMERYIDWNHIQFNYTVIGNPDLEPESSNGVTFGIEYDNRSRIQYSLMLYHTKFENLIEDFVIQPGLLSYQNIEKAKFSGIEFLSQIKISKEFDGQIGFNWIDNRDGNNKTIPNTIPFSISNILNYNNSKSSFNFSINTKWVAPI